MNTPSKPRSANVLMRLLFACILLVATAANIHAQGKAEADLTFFVVSDTHYGLSSEGDATIPKLVDEMNSLPGTAYPEKIGGKVGVPRGVIHIGDITNDGKAVYWEMFVKDYGLTGKEGRLKYPVYETFGNHDGGPKTPVRDGEKERNKGRVGLASMSDNGVFFSWDWDNIHFINLGVSPGTTTNPYDPEHSIDFCLSDLKKNVGNSGRPVILMHHFGFDKAHSLNWWPEDWRTTYYDIIKEYNVIGIMHGHAHKAEIYTWNNIDIYHPPHFSQEGPKNTGKVSHGFYVFQIKGNEMTVAERFLDGTWGKNMQKKKIFFSYPESGLPAVVNNGPWAVKTTTDSAKPSGKLIYEAASPTDLTLYWGTSDGGTKAESWQNSKKLGPQKVATPAEADITGLKQWTYYYYRVSASNSKGLAWAGASVNFCTSGTIPSNWKMQQFGEEQRPGQGANFENGVFSIRGSGRDIGDREPNDSFMFVYQDMEGDGEIKARIASAELKSENKFGVMIREALKDDSKNITLVYYPREGIRLTSRIKDAGKSTSAKLEGASKATPCWVKLVRSGNTFTGFTSADGTAWTQVGTPVSIEMPAKVFAGLAATSGNRIEPKINAASVDNVSITKTAAK